MGAYFGVSALMEDEPFTLTGTLQLRSDSIATTGLPPDFNCAGKSGCGDIGPGASVTVTDESGTLLAKSTLEAASVVRVGAC